MNLTLPVFLLITIFVFSASTLAKTEKIEIDSADTFAGGTISGRLLRANGRSRPYTEIELVPVGANKKSDDMRLWAITNSGGYFAFKRVPPGEYTLSVNFNEKPTDTSPFSTTFYPKTKDRSEAKVFQVKAGSRFNRLRFQLFPKIPERRITGKVVWNDGKPAKNAFITIFDVAFDNSVTLGVKTNANAFFSIKGFVGRKYVVGAILMDSAEIDVYSKPIARGFSDEFVLNATTKPLEITLKKLRVPDSEKKPLDDRIVGNIGLGYEK